MCPALGGIADNCNYFFLFDRSCGPPSWGQIGVACQFAFPRLDLAVVVLYLEFHHGMWVHEVELLDGSLERDQGFRLRLECCPPVVCARRIRNGEKRCRGDKKAQQCVLHFSPTRTEEKGFSLPNRPCRSVVDPSVEFPNVPASTEYI